MRRYPLFASNSRRALPRIVSMASFSLAALAAVFYIRRFRPDYLMVESPPLLLGCTGWLLSRAAGARLLLNISDIWPLSASELGALRQGGSLYRLLERLERFLYRSSYACTGQSEEIVRHMQSGGARRAWLFRNGVDVNRFPALSEKDFNQPLKIVYAGLLGVAQGILELCQNLQFDPQQIEFHIYGSGAEREAIETYLQESGKTSIILHEPRGRDAIPGILAMHDFALIPLVKPIYGAVPSKIYEAMAAGLPILFAGGGEGAKIIETYDLGWVCAPSDFSAIQAAIQEIISLPENILQEKRNNCLRAAKTLFSRDRQIENLDTLLRASI